MPKKVAKRSGRKPSGRAPAVSVIHLQGPEEERDWLTLLHDRSNYPKATIVRLALDDWARKHGHPARPEM